MTRDDYRVPIDDAIKARMNEIARKLGIALPEGWGFALFLFEYEGGSAPDGKPRMVWISSAERESMLSALQEFMRRQAS